MLWGMAVADELRQAVEALVAGAGPIQRRLVLAERHFVQVEPGELRSKLEHGLFMRIASGLVSTADEGLEPDEQSIEECVLTLDDSRATAIALDIMGLYELAASVPDAEKRALALLERSREHIDSGP
jgi:hypothetical protein